MSHLGAHVKVFFKVCVCVYYLLVDFIFTIMWRIPGTGEPGGLPSMGSHRVGHD